MGVDLAEQHPEVARLYDRSREILQRDLLAICRDGPEAELNSTRNSQPAIFLHSMAVLELLGRRWGAPGPFGRGIPAVATAGLSLGEYSALVFAGSLEFEDALRIVGLRGEFMQRACEAAGGGMAAVMGFAPDGVDSVVDEAKSEGMRVCVANYNSPEQTVISGEGVAVDEVVARLKARGARRVMPLNVVGAFHSPLMAPATRELEPHLRAVPLREPVVPFLSNVTGREARDPEEIREGLIRQVESSVRWTQSVEEILARGVDEILELGPGRVLQGLVRKVLAKAGAAPSREGPAPGESTGVQPTMRSLGTVADLSAVR
jgi:[acyl-carrier-protein] S-malonyltransferase